MSVDIAAVLRDEAKTARAVAVRLTCNSSNLICHSLLVSEAEPEGQGAVLTRSWDRDPPSGGTEITR